MLEKNEESKKIEHRVELVPNILSRNRRKFPWLIFLTLTGIGGLVILIVLPALINESTGCGQPEAVTYLNSIARSQQSHYLEKGNFSDSLKELGVGTKTLTSRYVYTIEINKETAVFNYGISRKEKLKSYVSGVFLVNPKTRTTQSILCKANSPGSSQFENPTDRNGILTCGNGTTEVSRSSPPEQIK